MIDLLELSEDNELRRFHICTLEAYKAVTSHCNKGIAKKVGAVMDTQQLLQCLKLKGMHFSLRAAYIDLVNSLYLEVEVRNKLMTRGEFILSLSDCSRSVSLSPVMPKERKQTIYCLAMAPLPGLSLAHRNQTYMSHNITSTFSRAPVTEGMMDFPIHDLKEMVFHDLEKLLSTR